MNLDVNFQGRSYTVKPSKKFSQLKKTLSAKIPELQKKAWQFYYYDDEGDDIQVVEEEEYQSFVEYAKSQKKGSKCEIRYKPQSKAENINNDDSDVQSQSQKAPSVSSKSVYQPESQSQGFSGDDFQQSEPSDDQNEAATTPSAIPAKETPKVQQTAGTKKDDPKPEDSDSSYVEEQSADDDYEIEEEEQSDIQQENKPGVITTESKIISEEASEPEPIKPTESKIINVEIPEPESAEAQSKQVTKVPQQKPTSVSKRQEKVKDPEPAVQKVEEKKEFVQKQPKVMKKRPEKRDEAPVVPVIQSQIATVTIPKEEYERLLNIEKEYQNRKFQQDDREFASGIKDAEKCTFCTTDNNLNVIPNFQNLLICDTCNDKYEIKIKVIPYRSNRSTTSRNSSMLSANRLF